MSQNNRNNLLVVFGTTLMAVLGVSSITPAFPAMMETLDLSETQVGMLITVFTFPGIFLTPVLGIVSDRFGRKPVLIPSLLLFGIAGGICFFIENYIFLLIFRFFQGVGASSLGALGTILVGDIYSGKQRTRIMGLNASVLSIGTALYPLIGGALAIFSCAHPFLLPLLALPIAFFAMKYLKNPEPIKNKTLKNYLKNTWTEIKDPGVYFLFIAIMLVFIVLYGSFLTYFSTMLGRVFDASSFVIGFIFFTASISSAIVSSQLGKLSQNFRKHKILITGFLMHFLSMIIILLIEGLWLFIIPAVIFGMGNGLLFPTIHTLLAEKSSLELRGIFMSINASMLRVGQTLGPPVIGIAFTFGHYQGAFATGGILALIGVLIGVFFLNSPEKSN